MSPEERKEYLEFLKQNQGIIDPVVAMHRVSIKLDLRPVKQAPKCMHPNLAAKVKTEVDKQVAAGFT